MTSHLAELCLCSNVLWKAELGADEIGDLAEEISEQSVEGVACFLLTAMVKCERRGTD